MNILVQDAQSRPVKALEIGIAGPGNSRLSGNDGKAKLPIGNANQGDWITLVVLHSPGTKDYVLLSPWDGRVQVASFADRPDNYIRVIVVQRGDRALLENGSFLASVTKRIVDQHNAGLDTSHSAAADVQANVAAVAREYGLSPAEVDTAIRAFGTTTRDPLHAGLVTLFERDYPTATKDFEDALRQHEAMYANAQAAATAEKEAVADSAFYLGVALFSQGKYAESVRAYKRCLDLRPDDAKVMNNLGMSLMENGDYAEAEGYYRAALEENQRLLASDDPIVAKQLNNLASLLYKRGDYAGAEELLRQALTIVEKANPPDDHNLALKLNNLSAVLLEEGHIDQAEVMCRRALDVTERAFGPDNPLLGTGLSNLGAILRAKGDYAGAEKLVRRSLNIEENALGPDYPLVGNDLNALGELLTDEQRYSDAEPLLRRALALHERVLRADHPDVATDLVSLTRVLIAEKKYPEAEPLVSRALAIHLKVYGPSSIAAVNDLNYLAGLNVLKGDYRKAESLYDRAVAMLTKLFGKDDPSTVAMEENLRRSREERVKHGND
ncbi:MAG: tetratricopeptide repeat protein [Janthinobacterium lividum]